MSRSDLLLKSITEFYEEPENFELLKGILEKTSGVSLRNLEWFITDYSKKKNFSYTTKTGKLFSVHMSYKSSLDGYSKKLFDPFCRTEKIEFHGIQTTVAQLKFIRWCIKNDIITTTKEVLDAPIEGVTS